MSRDLVLAISRPISSGLVLGLRLVRLVLVLSTPTPRSTPKLLHSMQSQTLPADATYTLSQSTSPVGTTSPAWSSSLLCCRPDGLELSTGQSQRPGSQQQQLQITT